jgi:cell division protein FtsW
MKQLISKLKDKGYGHLWALLALFSFMPVFSASSNLAYLGHGRNTLGYLVKHFAYMYRFCNYLCGSECSLSLFQGYFKMALPVWILLTYTLIKGRL